MFTSRVTSNASQPAPARPARNRSARNPVSIGGNDESRDVIPATLPPPRPPARNRGLGSPRWTRWRRGRGPRCAATARAHWGSRGAARPPPRRRRPARRAATSRSASAPRRSRRWPHTDPAPAARPPPARPRGWTARARARDRGRPPSSAPCSRGRRASRCRRPRARALPRDSGWGRRAAGSACAPPLRSHELLQRGDDVVAVDVAHDLDAAWAVEDKRVPRDRLLVARHQVDQLVDLPDRAGRQLGREVVATDDSAVLADAGLVDAPEAPGAMGGEHQPDGNRLAVAQVVAAGRLPGAP